jgi:hypothetical protein
MQRSTQRLKVLLLLATLGFAGGVAAHDDATLAKMKAPNGGQLKVAGGWHLELVQRPGAASGDNRLDLFVTEHDGKHVASAGLKASATILVGKEKLSARFVPDGENRLTAAAHYDPSAKPKIVVSVSGGGRSEQARFAP